MSSPTANINENRVAAIYATRENLDCAKAVILKKLGISERKIKVIAPADANLSEKLEGDSKEIGTSMLHKHITFGLIGLTLGMVLAFLLVQFGPLFTSQNPSFTYIALISPGLFVGLFVAGIYSLKPQHDAINMSVVEQNNGNNWALVIDTKETNMSKEDIIGEIKQTQTVEIRD